MTATNYFKDLNYSLANEDTTVEFEMTKRLGSKKILAVAGSGARSLPFLAHHPERLKIVDVAGPQVAFVRFKWLTLKRAVHSELVDFWNGSMAEEVRAARIRQWCEGEMDPAPLLQLLRDNPSIAPLYWGKWEKTFVTFSKVARAMLGGDNCDGFFKGQGVPSGWRWELLVRILGNRAVFNSLLYKGDFIKKNDPRSYTDYYQEAFSRLMRLEPRKSHFAQLCFLGRVQYQEGLPLEFQPEVHRAIQGQDLVPEFTQESLVAETDPDAFDFVSLSDVPCYFAGELEQSFWQTIRRKTVVGGVAVARYYLRTPEGMDLTGWEDATDEWRPLWEKELVQMYKFQVLRRVR